MSWVSRLINRRWRDWRDIETGFLVSTGRTGTEFLANFVNNHLDAVLALHEPKPDLLDLGIEVQRGEVSHVETRSAILQGREAVRRQVKQAGASYYLESNNNLVPLLDCLLGTFPESRVLFVTRHPETYVRSAFSKLHGGKYSLFGPTDRRRRLTPSDVVGDPYQEHWETMDQFERLCWMWCRYNDLIERLTLAYPYVKHVRYEDIFDAQSDFAGLRQSLDFLGLADRLRLTSEEVSAVMGNPKNQSHGYLLETADDWTPQQKQSFRRIIADQGDRYGY